MKLPVPPVPAAPESRDPSSFPQRVLFTVSGLTPQIITETIYALVEKEKPAFVPTRLVVMTTKAGANRVRLLLMGTAPGWLARLCADYRLPPIAFGPEDLRIIGSDTRAQLDDIRYDGDNKLAANAIVQAIAELTADPQTALHVSVAGGRKTMGFFAGYALSLYGRPQDRLSHVLVPPEFESHQDFFYPTPYSRVINTRDFGPRDTREADVSLADLPFVRMRDGLSEPLRTGRISYAEAVADAQDSLAPPLLVIDLSKQRVVAGSTEIKLQPALLALYAWLARRAKAGQPWIIKTGNRQAAAELHAHASGYLDEYRQIRDVEDLELTKAALKDGMYMAFFSPKLTQLNHKLITLIADPRPARYRVQRAGPRQQYSYGLSLAPEHITFVS